MVGDSEHWPAAAEARREEHPHLGFESEGRGPAAYISVLGGDAAIAEKVEKYLTKGRSTLKTTFPSFRKIFIWF